jgi:hypothetical protein
MTRRFFLKLTQGNTDLLEIPSQSDFEREYQLLLAEENRVAKHLLSALALAKDDIEAHCLLTVLRQALPSSVSPADGSQTNKNYFTFLMQAQESGGLIQEYAALAVNE